MAKAKEGEEASESDKPKKGGSAKGKEGDKPSKKTVKAEEGKKKAGKAPLKKAPARKTNGKQAAVVKSDAVPSVFSKPGQKHITPPKGDGTRGFYESLYEANPNSVIAILYCVEYGLFGGPAHQKVYQKYQDLKKEGLIKGTSGGIKPAAVKFLTKAKAGAKKGKD